MKREIAKGISYTVFSFLGHHLRLGVMIAMYFMFSKVSFASLFWMFGGVVCETLFLMFVPASTQRQNCSTAPLIETHT